MNLPDAIETERLTLRRPRLSDAGPIALYVGDRRVAEMLAAVPHPYPPGAAEAFIERALRDRASEHVWAMDAGKIEGPEFIGVISVISRKGMKELGFWVGPPFWNTGYASEAALAVVEAARASGVSRLDAGVGEGNEASVHVLTNAGFRETGRGEIFSVARNQMRPRRLFTLEFGS